MADIPGLKYHRTPRQRMAPGGEAEGSQSKARECHPCRAPWHRRTAKGTSFHPFLSGTHLAISLCGELLELNRKRFPDSAIAAQMAIRGIFFHKLPGFGGSSLPINWQANSKKI
ncbi:uncharacterized protein LOC125037211 [Penaeus chinensis]|uniref:uncharacterized protein LOC125037211 n=1 Tax=Penaeus chinensis TaxID=139456 RepID=UPI001FB70CD3|nr:uncharacterized protein LOC125037211 [Penaeus chinensis]